MKFVVSFSSGKDCMLSLHRMVKEGHEPVALLVTYNPKDKASWFHGADPVLLADIAGSLNIPLMLCETAGDNYNEDFEDKLRECMALGAEACVYGDIDLDEHLKWNSDRTDHVGMKAIMPLWKEDRLSLVHEVIGLGYKCVIKCVRPGKLPDSFLGKILSEEVLREMEPYGVDMCGENGDYHTIVVDGPLFSHPVPYKLGEILFLEYSHAIEINPVK